MVYSNEEKRACYTIDTIMNSHVVYNLLLEHVISFDVLTCILTQSDIPHFLSQFYSS